MKSLQPRNAGSTLVACMAIVVILSVIVGTALNFTQTVARNSQRSRKNAGAVSVAEGGVEVMFARWRSAGRAAVQSNQGLPPISAFSSIASTLNAPSAADYPDFAGFTFAGFTLTPVDRFNTALSGNPTSVIAPLNGRPGWVARTYNYIGKATVSAPAVGTPTLATVGRRFQKADAPIFQAAIFYEMDLEIHPGANMEVTGLVHTNSDLYAAAGGSNDGHNLAFARNVSYSDTYSEGFAPGDPRTAFAAPIFRNGKDSQLNQVARLEPVGTEPASVFNKTDANLNNDGFRELIERPVATQVDPPEIAALRFYNQAGLRILVDTSRPTTDASRIRIYNGNNVELTAAGGPAVAAVVTAVKAAVSNGEVINDNREADRVNLTTLDVSKVGAISSAFAALPASASSSGSSAQLNTYNNVIYICDVSADPNGGTSPVAGGSSAEKAIRIKNGAVLPSDLTIASENPVYIQGDYNTGGPNASVPTNAATPGSPMSAFSDPDAPGYTRKSSAILADAVTILSNNWNDANSSASVSSRVATNTTVNAALLAGIVPTNDGGNGRYSGGAENFPRFLEDWGGGAKILSYYGSMVALFPSKQGKGPWGSANVYAIPTRRWFFDSNFIQNPPPGTLQAVNYSRGRWIRY